MSTAVPTRRLPVVVVVAVAGLAVAAAVLVVVLNRGRPWITPDAVTYLGVAENVAEGKGVTAPFRNTLDPFSATPSDEVPLVRWPPGYPVVLAVLVLAGLAPATAAEVVNVAAAAVLVVLTAAVAWRATSRPGLAVLGAALAAGSGAVLPAGRYALSELLFVTIVVAFLYLALHTAQGGGRVAWAMVAAASAATMVRWAGIALVVPAVVACLVGRRPGHRWRPAVAAAAVPAAFAVLWAVVLAATADEQPRRVAWHPSLDTDGLLAGMGALLDPRSVLPGGRLPVGVAATALLAGAAVVAAVRRPQPLLAVASATGLGYLAVLLASRAVLDAAIPWDDRILGPLYPVLLLVVLAAVAAAGASSRVIRWVGLAAAVVVVAGHLGGLPALVRAADEPVGYTSERWQAVPADDLGVALAPYPVLASNRPDVVWLRLRRSSLTVPRRVDPATTRPNPRLALDLDALARTLARGGAVVWFDDPTNPRAYLAAEGEVVRALDLRTVATFPAARVYAAGAPPG